uniref:Uncharacterized protein n=1 Tax=Alexandrium monilatum TaxID=311494 RepID=A0A7S4PUT9_9DINO
MAFGVFVAMGCVTMVALLGLLCIQSKYPANYLALLAVTLLVGITWGLGGSYLATHVHSQLLGILTAIVAWSLGGNPLWSGLAAIVSLLQVGWLLLDVGDKLEDCNPDDFMHIVISMDSTLLVVVSIPLFVIVACFLHSSTRLAVDEQPNVEQV